MRMAVMSDSHGNAAAIERMLQKEPGATVIIHLGDGASEAFRLKEQCPSRRWHIVRGNCDVGGDAPQNEIVTLGGKRFYLTHGHAEGVKWGMLNLSLAARSCEADAALYGHTHIADVDYEGGVLLLNPGSIGETGSYALITVENGVIRTEMRRL